MSSPTEDGLDVHSVFSAVVCSSEESIFLVCCEGKRYPVNELLARNCTPYFDAVLGNPMSEAGKFASQRAALA